MNACEVNFDGLVGLTHNYSGLATGNIAAQRHQSLFSNPKQAALQGLQKMWALAQLGFVQGVLPPQERPSISTLRRLGFSGTDNEILARAGEQAPAVLAACSSAASMWVANAATVSPSADTSDAKVHFTPANLVSHLHRALEAETTGHVLKAIFSDPRYFVHHAALPPAPQLGDEGAANHTRFCADYGEPGVEFFVFGRYGFGEKSSGPQRYIARQSHEASRAIARLHHLTEAKTCFAQQNPAAIDRGVFHNDVIAVGNRNVLFMHQHALVDTDRVLTELRTKLAPLELITVIVKENEVSLDEAVASYLFNSQLLSLPNGKMLLIAPQECREQARIATYLDKLMNSGGPIAEIQTFDLKQSMQNGGGPACLRLRVVLTDVERAAVRAKVFLDDSLYRQLTAWVEKNYRDRLHPSDLADPKLLLEGQQALDELTQILQLGSIYPFQID